MATEKRYACDDCKKQFVRPEHLYRHRLNHRPKRIYNCSSCSKTFVRRDLLQRHEKRHEQEMPASRPVERHDPGVNSSLSSSIECPPSSLINEPGNIAATPNTDTFHVFFDPSTDVQATRQDLDWLFSAHLPIDSTIDDAFTTYWDPSVPLPISPSSVTSLHSLQERASLALSPQSEIRSRVLLALDLILPQQMLQGSFFTPASLETFYDIYFTNYNAHFPILH